MAQSGTLVVDTDELYKHARNIDTQALGLDGAKLALDQIDGLEPHWQGAQHDTFVREYRGQIEMLTHAVSQFRKFTNLLLQAAEIYRNMTPEVEDVVNTLHTGA